MSRSAFEDYLNLTGLTLTKVSELSGVPRATLSGLLGGHHRAAVPTAHKLAAAMGIQPGTLFPSMIPALAEAIAAQHQVAA